MRPALDDNASVITDIWRSAILKMYIGGDWVDRDEKISVFNPYDNSLIDTVPAATH